MARVCLCSEPDLPVGLLTVFFSSAIIGFIERIVDLYGSFDFSPIAGDLNHMFSPSEAALQRNRND
jgi:hypothetical protein